MAYTAWDGNDMFAIRPNEHVNEITPAPWELYFSDFEAINDDAEANAEEFGHADGRALLIGHYWSVDEAKSAAERALEDKKHNRGLWYHGSGDLPPNWLLKGDDQ